MSVSIKFNDHLLSMNEDDQENECLVCYDQLTSENTITLLCNHKFHYECIVKSYTMNTNKKKNCPYCRRNGGWLKLPENHTPIRNVHKEYYLKKKLLTCCKAILQSGPNKGKQCLNKAKVCYGGYCGCHKKYNIIV